MWQSLAYEEGSCYYYGLKYKNRYNILWKDNNLSHEESNTALLVDYVYDGIERHHQYVRHFYLYRNQKCGEMKHVKEEDFLVTMDYMMKLRAKMHQIYSSKFHALMTKGCSVHVYFIKGHMTKDKVRAMLSEKGSDQCDYQMVCIDINPSSTGQGG